MSDPFSDLQSAVNTVSGNSNLSLPSAGPIGDSLSNATGIRTPGDAFNQAVNLGLNYVSYGLIGYENGKISKGLGTRAADESLGEVTGRNAARKQIMVQQDAINAEAATKAQQLKNEQTRKFQQDVSASNYAYSVQQTSNAKGNSYLGNNINNDILGL